MKQTLVRIAILSAACSLTGCDKLSHLTSDAKGRTSQLKATRSVQIRNDEPDAGIQFGFVVTNEGEEGLLTISAQLSCSEGEWERTQRLRFRKGQRRKVSYFFHEPTVNATNVQSTAAVLPKAR